MKTSTHKKQQCCSMEKQQLVQSLYQCDFCTTSYDEHARCYRDAARRSGERSQTCMT